jgi:signal transduction histidine kinase
MTFPGGPNTLFSMPDTRQSSTTPGRPQAFWRTAWPEIGPADSDSLRRRKFAVRIGHVAMVLLLFAAAGSTPLSIPRDYSGRVVAGLAAACLLYAWWNLLGTAGIVTLVLWERNEPPPSSLRLPRIGALPFFIVQVGLATLIYCASDHGRTPSLIWLLLLPPVAYAVFILEWRGIAVISALMLAVLILSLRRWHDWPFALYGGLAFGFAILFTIVFSVLAVQSEKARSEVQRLAAELGAANRRLREYAVQAEELSATRERNRIAREIHDSLGHFLTVANVQLEAARALAPTNPAQAHAAVGKAQAFIQEGLQDIRRSVASLRTSPLANKPLSQALHELVDASGAETPVAEFALRGAPRDLPPPVELSLYRAAQEGLTNARKHARAQHVSVVLDFRTERAVLLSVQDDGCGATNELEQGGFGLRGLRERAQLLGGALRIQTAPNAGYVLNFEVPA